MANPLLSAVTAWRRRQMRRAWNALAPPASRPQAEPQPKPAPSYQMKLGVLGIMKNEAMNIDEWVDHYLWMGASKIFLIDNGSTDDTVAKAQDWVTKGAVELVEYHGRHQQTEHYRTAFQHFRIDQRCEWLLIADLDEFWFCPDGSRLDEALDSFASYDVIYCNWAVFGSSGLIDHPPSVREGFVWRRPWLHGHDETKYICRSRVAGRPGALGIHKVWGADSGRTVSDTRRFQLNHYMIQSEAFFRAVKMTRGASDAEKHEFIRDMGYFHRNNRGCDMEDRQLANLVAARKR
jgi:hypothetical protein